MTDSWLVLNIIYGYSKYRKGVQAQDMVGLESTRNSCPVSCTGDFLTIRNIDGTCNNLNNPTWGSSEIPLTRLEDPDYADSELCVSRNYF